MMDRAEVMRFSRRTGWNTEESDLARAYRRRAEAGLPIADLTVSNPTRCGFSFPQDLLQLLTQPQALDYDPQPRGCWARGRLSVATTGITESGWTLHRSFSLPVPARLIAFCFDLCAIRVRRYEVPQPGYPLFDYLAVLDDVRVRPAPLVYDHGWQIDPEGFRRAITAQTRAIVLGSPQQPNRAPYRSRGRWRNWPHSAANSSYR